MEDSTDNTLNFLDVTIIIKNNFIEFDLYHKPTLSGKYLNYELHPFCHKKDTTIGLVDRIILLSHPKFHKNLSLVINILLENTGNIIFQVTDNVHEKDSKIYLNILSIVSLSRKCSEA